MASTIGPWGQVIRALANTRTDLKDVINTALLQEAEFYRTKIVAGLQTQAPGWGEPFKPLSQTTIALRRFFGFKGTKALVRNSYLKNSIAAVKVADGEVFCGVLRTAKGSNGESLVDIAKMNEEGSKPIVIKITPKMAALLHMAFRAFGGTNRMGPAPPSTGIIVIQIPARPFMGPVFERYSPPDIATERFSARVRKLMRERDKIWDADGQSTAKPKED